LKFFEKEHRFFPLNAVFWALPLKHEDAKCLLSKDLATKMHKKHKTTDYTAFALPAFCGKVFSLSELFQKPLPCPRRLLAFIITQSKDTDLGCGSIFGFQRT